MERRLPSRTTLLIHMGLVCLCLGVLARPAEAQYEGFGATTTGGQGFPVVHVTSLGDSGPGTLREALAAGNRTIVFDVGGEIVLSDFLYVNGGFVTIDGFSAPAPGITLRHRGLIIRGLKHGAHDVIVRGIRVRDSTIDGIQIAYGASTIVIDHCSVFNSGDGNIDITEDSHDVTVSWSILARPAAPQKNMLIKFRASRVTLHHDIFIATQRNPLASIDDVPTPATDTTVDMRNNLVWGWDHGHGTMIRNNALANVVANFYDSPSSSVRDRLFALIVCPADCYGRIGTAGRAYVADNVNFRGPEVNGFSTETTPFAAPPVTTGDACNAATSVLANAGVRPLDATDTGILSAIQLPACVPNLAMQSVAPSGPAASGDTVTLSYTVANVGPASADRFTVGFWLSADATLGARDELLATVAIDHLGGGATLEESVSVTVPPVAPGLYRIIAIADPDRALPDPSRVNNTKLAALRVPAPDLAVNALTMPSFVLAGAPFEVGDTTGNLGPGVAPASTTRFYLSHDRTFGAHDVFLGQRAVPSLPPHGSSTARTTLVLPSGTPSGTYYVLATADATQTTPERTELNNSKWRSLVVTVP